MFALILELLWDTILFNLGLAFLKAITFGRYPNALLTSGQQTLVHIVGLLVLVTLVVLLGLFLSG